MNARQLRERLAGSNPPVLVNVLPPEFHAARRIPGSVNACVYEIAFLDHVAALGLDAGQPIVVYGAGSGSHEAHAAAVKLLQAGYREVGEFTGGLDEWAAAGFALEGDGGDPGAPVPDGDFSVDVAQSIVRWTGRNLFNHHSGTVRLASGALSVRGGTLAAAAFDIDLNSIACEDIADAGMNALLVGHLKNSDFFEVDRHPLARFVASACTPVPGATDGTPNFRLAGAFTLRGVTRPLDLPIVAAAADADHLTGQAQFEIDRTEFGSLYGSGRFFRFLGKHLVNDHIALHVKIHATRVA